MTAKITRFAPSPTGNLHIGSARTALINFIVSKQNANSKFYLRIEDTDRKRSNSKFKDNIINGLKWLGINWEDEIQIQSNRIKRHQEVALNLLEKKFAYKCICSEEKLENQRKLIKLNKAFSKKICNTCKDNNDIQKLSEGFVIRIKLPDEGTIKIKDKIQGEISVLNNELDDFILLREDKSPTYMLSVVVDDNDLGINFIIRGDDHLNNSFRQYYIYKYLNWELPTYAHIPLVHGEDGSKLSKRHGSVDVLEFKKNGYLPEAIINNLILLGWSPKQENELIKLNDIINKFDINKLSKSSSIFSYKKLNFFNNYYLRSDIGLEKFIDFCKNNEVLNKLIQKNDNKLKHIFQIYKKDLNNFSEILNVTSLYFNEDYKLDQSTNFGEDLNSLINEFMHNVSKIENWNRDNIQKTILDFLKLKKVKFPILGKPVRYLLIKSYNGPSISDIFIILGKKDSLDRINQYIEKY